MGLISRVSSRTYRTPFVTMVFNKHVEVGRICYVPDLGKIACIVDVADMRHVLVDGDSINRQKIDLKAFKDQDINGQWAGSAWAQKLAKKKLRAGLNDFQRFKLMKLKQQKRQIVNSQLKKMK